MKPIPIEWRERIVRAFEEEGQSTAEVAERFMIEQRTVQRLLQQKRETGSLEPGQPGGSREPEIRGEDEQRLRAAVEEHPDATLEELIAICGFDVHPSTMCRTLQRLGLPLKRKVPQAAERDSARVQQERAEWENSTQGIDPERFVFIDEMGITTKMARRSGRAPVGERVIASVPQRHYQSLSVLGAVRLSGETPMMTYPGGTTTERVETFIEEHLSGTLRKGDIVVADNLAAHKAQRVREVIESHKAQLWLLPPYSPDFNPIERLWSKVKTALRAAAARTTDTLRDALQQTLPTITESDIKGWFKHANYATT